MKVAFIFPLFCFSTFFVFAQYTQPILVTDATIFQIHDPYQFTFIHKTPIHAVDTFVEKLTHEFNEWNQLADMLDKIAASKTDEAFYFLYASCLVTKNPNPENNLFHSLSNLVTSHGGFELLNNYFLNNAVDKSLPFLKFKKKVLLLCKKMKPTFYFCQQPTTLELYEEEMKEVRIRKYDRRIIKIINRNSDLRKGNNADSISNQISRLPFVTDVLWDGCYEKLLVYPGYFNLGVNMNIDGKIVERSYHIQGAKLRYLSLKIGNRIYFRRTIFQDESSLDYKSCFYSPGFIEAAREYCKSKNK